MVVKTSVQASRVRLKWMKIRDNAGEVKKLSAFGFRHPLFLNFFQNIRDGDFIACLAIEEENSRSFIGYIVYRWSEVWIYVLDLAIVPGADRPDVLVRIVEKMIERLKARRREFIFADVREGNDKLILAMKHCGFRAIRVLRNFFKDEDSYRMAYSIKGSEFLIEETEKDMEGQLAN